MLYVASQARKVIAEALKILPFQLAKRQECKRLWVGGLPTPLVAGCVSQDGFSTRLAVVLAAFLGMAEGTP